MKLNKNTIIDLYKALSDLRGAPTAVAGERGKLEVIHEPYPLSEKAKWNAAKDRSILKRYVVADDELTQDRVAELNAFKRVQRDMWKDEQDPEARAKKQAASRDLIQDKVDEMNEEATKIGRTEEEIEGLLFIPAAGLCLKSSKIPPTVISELMPLIEGTPEFEEEKPKK